VRHLSALDVVAALGQLAAVTPGEIHRSALNVAISAVQFRDAIETAIEQHQHAQAQVLAARGPGAAWDAQEDQHLRVAFESGMSLDAIAERHGRDPLEVAQRLHRPLGILTEQAVDEIRQARLRQRRDEPLLQANLLPAELPASTPVAAPAPEVAAPPPVAAAPIVAPAPVAPATAPTPVAAPAPAPAVVTVPMTTDSVPAVVEAAAPVVAPVASPVASLETPAAAAAHASKPALTEAEDKAVQSVLTKFMAKNAPKAALRTYVDSDKFTTKVRPEVLVWMRAELDRLG
jgi:hypothetical protein